MANRYDTNLILDRIADALDDDQNSALIASLDDIASAIGGGGGSGAGLVSDAFDDTRTYAVGDYCIHNNTLYRCTTAIQTPGAWNINDWQATNAGTELSTLNSKLSGQKPADITSPYIGKTLSQQLYYIFQRIDFTKLTPYSYINVEGRIFRINEKTNSRAQFTYQTTVVSNVCVSYRIGDGVNNAYMTSGTTTTNISENSAEADMLLYY